MREKISDEVSCLLILPYRGESAKKVLRSSLENLCSRIEVPFVSLILKSYNFISIHRRPEKQPKMVNNGGVKYLFRWSETGCNSRSGVTRRHLHQRVREHASRQSGGVPAIYDHLLMHDIRPSIKNHLGCFEVLEKSSSWRLLLFTEAYHIKYQNL